MTAIEEPTAIDNSTDNAEPVHLWPNRGRGGRGIRAACGATKLNHDCQPHVLTPELWENPRCPDCGRPFCPLCLAAISIQMEEAR